MKESARDIFGERTERYASLDIFSQESFFRPLVELAAVAPGERVLDLAAGPGVLSIMLSRNALSVVACDVTPEMMSIAEANIARSGQSNISLVEADATRLPFGDDSFDLAACRLAFHHFPEPETTLSELRRVLIPGGRFVLEDVFGPEDGEMSAVREQFELLLDPSHIRSHSPTELRGMFETAGFQVRELTQLAAEDLTLDILLDLERIDTSERRRQTITLLKENLGRDLGGVTAREEDGGIVLAWQVLMLAATSP